MTPTLSTSLETGLSRSTGSLSVREHGRRDALGTETSARSFVDVLGSLAGASGGLGSVKSRGAQGMFDVPGSSGRSGRLANLRAETRAADRLGADDPRLDTASVDARRDTQQLAPAGVADISPVAPQHAADAGSPMRVEAPEYTASSISQESSSAEDFNATPHARSATSGDGSFPGAKERGGALQVPPTEIGSAVPLSAADGAATILPSPAASAPSNGTKTAPPAMQIAQILAGRGQPELARGATATTPAPHNQRSSNSPRGEATMAKPAEGQTRSGGAGVEVDAVEFRPGAFDDLVRSIRLRATDRLSSARLHLDPPELGRMRVDVRLEGDTIQVDVHTENEKTRDILQDRLGQLRVALEQAGVTVDRLDVNVNSQAADGGDSHAEQLDSQSTRRETNRRGPGSFNSALAEDARPAEVSAWDDSAVWRRGRVDVRV